MLKQKCSHLILQAMNKKTTSMEKFVEDLGAKNLSVAQWARQNNFKPDQVYGLLRGHLSGRRGVSRQILTRMGVEPPPVIKVRAKPKAIA